ncbi:MAG TPA: hypothetical protein DEF34_05220 [Desulfotomaculum sp.]|nr:hypothetical protein [Desulfotomaculum sp.]
MGIFYSKLLNQLPPVQPALHKEYSTDQMTIIQTKHVFPEVGCFDCYQFVLPLASFPPVQVEKSKHKLQKNNVFPVNPNQHHQVLEPQNNGLYIPIFIERECLQQTSHTVFGKTEVVFANENHKPSRQLLNLLETFIEESINKQSGYDFVLNILQIQIIVMLLRELKSNLPDEINRRQYSDVKGIRKAIDFMTEHCTENLTLEDMAQLTNYSPFHFIKIFKSETGNTPFQYLLDIKLSRAKDMLTHRKEMTITEICYLCGFNNLSHFTAVFKRKTGVSPSRYRQMV